MCTYKRIMFMSRRTITSRSTIMGCSTTMGCSTIKNKSFKMLEIIFGGRVTPGQRGRMPYIKHVMQNRHKNDRTTHPAGHVIPFCATFKLLPCPHCPELLVGTLTAVPVVGWLVGWLTRVGVEQASWNMYNNEPDGIQVWCLTRNPDC